MLICQIFLLVIFYAHASSAYDISGTVYYSGTKTERIYIGTDNNKGVSIASSGSFTIRGLTPGEYTLWAYMDTHGTGNPHATDPRGMSSSITITNSNISGVVLAVVDPPPVAPVTPLLKHIVSGDRCAAVLWEAPDDSYGFEIADSYNVYWSTDASVSPTHTTGGGSKVGIPANGTDFLLQSGLTNGSAFYYVMTANVGAQESAPSNVVGPITIGPKAGGHSVSGTVSFPGVTPTGPLYVVVDNRFNDNDSYMTVISSPSTSQAFTVTGVPDAYYNVFAVLDQNNNGHMEAGDLFWSNDVYLDSYWGRIAVNGANVTGVTLSLPTQNAVPAITTEHSKYDVVDDYSTTFSVTGVRKRPVNVSLIGGPNVTGPIDLSVFGLEAAQSFYSPDFIPVAGNAYVFEVTYSDNTSQTFTPSITAVLAPPTAISPCSTISYTPAPTFTWAPPAQQPSDVDYNFELSGANDFHWDIYKLPPTQLSFLFNYDGSAPQQSLYQGAHYSWWVEARDSYGNSARGYTSFYNGTDSTAPMVTSTMPGNGAMGVDATASIDAVFSEIMDGDSIYNYDGYGSVSLSGPAGAVNGTVSYDPQTSTATFTPSSPLSYNATYTATLSSYVTDLAGNHLSGDASWSFTTASGPIYTLSYTKAGTGGGTVTSNPAGLSSTGSSSSTFASGTVVTLFASPDTNSVFSGWSGECAGTGNCQITMNSNKNVTGTFSFVQPVKNANTSNYYSSLSTAYSEATSGCTLMAREFIFIEVLNFTRDIAVTLTGGFDSNYLDNSYYSVLQGNLTIGTGAVTIGNLIIK